MNDKPSDKILGLLTELRAPEPIAPAALTLFVFASRHHAQRCGFRFDGVHPARPDFVAYWPALGATPLAARRFQTVVNLYGRLPEQIEQFMREQQRVFGDQAIWIET